MNQPKKYPSASTFQRIQFPCALNSLLSANSSDAITPQSIHIWFNANRFRRTQSGSWNRLGTIFATELRRARLRADACRSPPSLISRRGLREDQRRKKLALARCRSRGRGARKLRHNASRQEGRIDLLEGVSKSLRISLKRHGVTEMIVKDQSAEFQGLPHHRYHRVASALCCLINAGVGRPQPKLAYPTAPPAAPLRDAQNK